MSQLRQNVRNFMLCHTLEEVRLEMSISDPTRLAVIQQLMFEGFWVDRRTMYLDWFNNFLTVPVFAEKYGLTEELAMQLIGEERESDENKSKNS